MGGGFAGGGHGPHFFLNRTLSRMFSRKFALASFSKASKTFLTLALPESRSVSWKFEYLYQDYFILLLLQEKRNL